VRKENAGKVRGAPHLMAKRCNVQKLERGFLVLENLRDGTRVRRSDE
jgi:hypothetical protein